MKPTLEGGGHGRHSMKGLVEWNRSGGYIGTTEDGKKFDIYGDVAPSPMELVLHAHAACSMIDVMVGLKDRIEEISMAKVEIEGERAEENPRIFTSIMMKYIIRGEVPEKLVRRLIEQSHETFCSVGIMITKSGANLDWSLDFAN
tara:strand:+ start:64 stop:498 length:435 start_codon:yes stop_codon:yes gene_type:complete